MTPIERARELIGVPWKHQGRSAQTGIDCVGLIIHAFQITAPVPRYGRDPVSGMLEAELDKHFTLTSDLAEGRVVAMAYAGPIRHVGMVGKSEDGRMTLIHTDSILGRVTEHALDAKWLRRIKRIYRQ